MARKRLLAGAAGLGIAAALGVPAVRQRIWSRVLKLPPAQNAVRAERNIPVPVGDGVTLTTDHYAPRGPGAFPTILIRSPYGKWAEAGIAGMIWGLLAQRMAERGYHVVVQLTRGRFGSGGTFEPLVDEATDGMATLEWLRAQRWFDGRLGTWGPSYLGYVQWALAAAAPPELQAMVPMVTGAQLGSLTHMDGAFGLDTLLTWVGITETQSTPENPTPSWPALFLAVAGMEKRLERGFRQLPLGAADAQVVGHSVGFYQDWLRHTDLRTPYWQQRDHTAKVPNVAVPMHFFGGWYDLIQREMLADYSAQVAAGRAPFLTIGPWIHADDEMVLEALRGGLRWFDRHLKDAPPEAREPVRVFQMGADEWREYPTWPPPAQITPFFLHGGFALGREQPADALPDRFRYDPSDPTPVIGGARLNSPINGPQDQRPLEARADVLCYTSAPLDRDVDVIGPVRLVLYVRSSLPHTDFLGRLCDVQPDGRSVNLCEGLLRLVPGSGAPQPDGSLRIEIDMWNTAVRFRRGHRIRLHVASGAHPRWNRNLGTGEPLVSGTAMRAADQTIFHDAEHPSALMLPLV